MRKSRMFVSMLGLSAALHGLVMFGTGKNIFHAPPAVSENRFTSTLKIVKAGTRPQQNAAAKPPEKKPVGKPVAEKPSEPPPEMIPAQETPHNGEVQDNDSAEDGGANDEEAESGGANYAGKQEDGTITGREYEALLAYVKDFISKNLVYPAMARRRNIEGIVAVYFEIDSNGAVSAITVAHSSGSPLLDNAAVSLVKKIHAVKNLTIKTKLALRVNIDYELTE